MSGDPMDASLQYNNIFERRIIIQNHIYIIPTFHAWFYLTTSKFLKYDILVGKFLLINLK